MSTGATEKSLQFIDRYLKKRKNNLGIKFRQTSMNIVAWPLFVYVNPVTLAA